MLIVIGVLIFHIVGWIIFIIVCCHNGTMKYANKFGDGIRFAKPSDLIFCTLFVWEIYVLLDVGVGVSNKINHYFYERYNK